MAVRRSGPWGINQLCHQLAVGVNLFVLEEEEEEEGIHNHHHLAGRVCPEALLVHWPSRSSDDYSCPNGGNDEKDEKPNPYWLAALKQHLVNEVTRFFGTNRYFWFN